MVKTFVITPSKVVAEAVKVAVGMRYPEFKDNVLTYVMTGNDGLKHFQAAAEWVEREVLVGDLVHDRFVGILDLPRASRASDIRALGWVQGNLILAFPEVQWIPLYREAQLFDVPDSVDGRAVMTLDRAIRMCQGDYSPLFDGDGLRSLLMIRAHGDPGLDYARSDAAVSLDEETNFAFINAYTAYRFGYRAFPISSGAVADELLRKKGSVSKRGGALPMAHGLLDVPPQKESGDAHSKKNAEYRERLANPAIVAFEDVCLEFSDTTVSDSRQTEFGENRDSKFGFPLLKNANLRVISTASRREEKFANKSTRPETAEKYLRHLTNDYGGRYRRLRGERFSWRRIKDKLSRWWFNFSGGWAGSWLVSILDFVVITGVLISAFFYESILVLPVMLVVFFLRGMLRHALQAAVERGSPTLRHFRWLMKYLVRRSQWRFLPKRFCDHCPIKDIHRDRNTYWEIARKPLAGIFGLRNKCDLPNGSGYLGIDNSERVRKLYRNARLYCKFAYNRKGDEHNSHAAPGMAMEIAVRLLRRARRMMSSVIDAEGAVHGAVLATVAGELLDYKTPSVSIEALTLKHHFEILAECEFVGVQAHLAMEDRYIDIHNAMRRICGSEDGIVRESVYTSGMAELVDKLIQLLKSKGKGEEASYFSRRSRMLHRRLLRPFLRNFFAYPEWVMRDGWNFFISLSAFFFIIMAYLHFKLGLSMFTSLVDAYQIMMFKELSQIDLKMEEARIIMLFAKQVAILHLGIIGAKLTSMLNRR